MRRCCQLLVIAALLSIFGGGCSMFAVRDGYFACTRYNYRYLYLSSPLAAGMIIGSEVAMPPLLLVSVPVGFAWWAGVEVVPGLAWDVIAVPWDTAKLYWK